MFLFGFIYYYFLREAHKADLQQRSAEVRIRHMETQELVRQHETTYNEIYAIANAKVGSDEFRELMYRLNERDSQKYGTTY